MVRACLLLVSLWVGMDYVRNSSLWHPNMFDDGMNDDVSVFSANRNDVSAQKGRI